MSFRKVTLRIAALTICLACQTGLGSGPARSEPSSPTETPERPPLPPPRPGQEAREPPRTADPDAEACLARLVTLGVKAEPLAAIHGGECEAAHPLRLTRLGDVAIAGEVTTVCPMAEALARWAVEVVAPAAARELKRKLTGIAIGTSYACRSRNNVPGAKLSEHGAANAVDVASFAFAEGAPVSIKADDPASPEGRFVAAIRAGACTHFATILGPGSDAYHPDHLHLDLQPRRSGYKLCQ